MKIKKFGILFAFTVMLCLPKLISGACSPNEVEWPGYAYMRSDGTMVFYCPTFSFVNATCCIQNLGGEE